MYLKMRTGNTLRKNYGNVSYRYIDIIDKGMRAYILREEYKGRQYELTNNSGLLPYLFLFTNNFGVKFKAFVVEYMRGYSLI